MNEFWAKLDQTQRRTTVIGLSVLFLIVNFVWVWPHFGDWGRTKARLEAATKTVQMRERMIAQVPPLQAQEGKLTSEGADVPIEDAAFQFARTIQVQAAQTGVRIVSSGNTREVTSTNQYFMEKTQTITVQSDEKQLVDFLYQLGQGTSLVRVRAISVQPDPPHQMLNSQITLVASYQKSPSKPVASRGATPAPAPAKPPVPAPTATPKKP